MSNISSDEELDNGHILPDSLRKFIQITDGYMKQANRELKSIANISDKKEYKSKLRVLKNKYKFLNKHKIDKRTSNKKTFRMDFKNMVEELKMQHEYLQDGDKNPNYICRSHLKKITKYIQNKLRGLVKHAQAGKTGLCIQEMINSIKKGKTIVCFAKNTLDANDQWASRAITALKIEFPDKPLDEIIGVLATKCKNKAVRHLKKQSDAENAIYKGEIQVLFVCSQSQRPSDILDILDSPFNDKYEKMFDIQYDECHNPKEGIPAHRTVVENILILPCVNMLLLCTATPEPLWVNSEEPSDWLNIWSKDVIMGNSFDFTKNDKIKSDSPEYSSLQDAQIIKYECKSIIDLKMPKQGFIKTLLYCYENKYCSKPIHHYHSPNPDRHYYEDNNTTNPKRKGADLLRAIVTKFIKRSMLGMGGLSFFKNEKKSYENGIDSLTNIIPNINDALYPDHPPVNVAEGPIREQTISIHLMSTPCRVLLTRSLQEFAINLPYKPYVLGLYGGKNMLMFVNDLGETINENVSKIMGDGEFNEQLYKLIKDKSINDRSFICMGNYEQTGESITYVNNKYGIVNSVHILSSFGDDCAWKDYQRACRLNYKLGGFDLTYFPEKYLIGDENVIDNALRIELDRDHHIDQLINGGYSNLTPLVTNTNYQVDDVSVKSLQQSIPVRISVLEPGEPNVLRFKNIMGKKKRTDDLDELSQLLYDMYKSGDIEIDDRTKILKGEWDKGNNPFKINQNKCYTEKCKNKKGNWKFDNYKNN